MKKHIRRRFAQVGLFLAATALISTPSVWSQTAQELPKGPVTLVVPFAPGGATDVVSRMVGQKLSERIGRAVVVENVAGAGGTIGANKVRRANPDGNTLLMGTVATHAIQPLSTKPVPYDPQRDFTPISLLATVPNVILVSNNVKANNVRELIALAKAKPTEFNYGSSGLGTPPHLSGELFNTMVGVNMAHVPYKGGGPAMVDLVGGQIPVLFDVLTGAASQIRSGSVRALAVTSSHRVAAFPDLPTMAEAGVPGYETYTWNAVFGPAGMSRPMVETLSRELQAVIAMPDVQTKLKDLSATPVGSSPEMLASLVKSELAKWGPVIQSMGGLKRD